MRPTLITDLSVIGGLVAILLLLGPDLKKVELFNVVGIERVEQAVRNQEAKLERQAEQLQNIQNSLSIIRTDVRTDVSPSFDVRFDLGQALASEPERAQLVLKRAEMISPPSDATGGPTPARLQKERELAELAARVEAWDVAGDPTRDPAQRVAVLGADVPTPRQIQVAKLWRDTLAPQIAAVRGISLRLAQGEPVTDDELEQSLTLARRIVATLDASLASVN